MEPWLEEIIQLSETVLGREFGTTAYWVMTGLLAGCLMVFGWSFISLVLRARSGLITTFLGLVLPLAVGAFALAAVEIHANPSLTNELAQQVLPWVAFGLGAFVTVLTLSRAVFGFKEGKSLLAVLFVYALAAGVIFLGRSIFESTESGLDKIERRDYESFNLFD
jgi:hypothetical protein